MDIKTESQVIKYVNNNARYLDFNGGVYYVQWGGKIYKHKTDPSNLVEMIMQKIKTLNNGK